MDKYEWDLETKQKMHIMQLEEENEALRGELSPLRKDNEKLSQVSLKIIGFQQSLKEENEELRKEIEELKEINERIELYTRRRG
ncbi:MAG: hypothetical protein GY941_28995 [Planctomycetes bacterium]|nr:hypothetical protein [Planctomycetota bacterium]